MNTTAAARHSITAPSRWLLVIVAAAVAVTAVLASASRADAHRNDESYLYLDVGDSTLSGSVEIPYGDLRTIFGLEISGTLDEVEAEFERELSMLQAYALENTSIGADGELWTLTFDGFELLEEEDVDENGLGYLILPYDAAVPTAEVPQVLDVVFTPTLEEIDGRNNIVLVSNDWKRGVVEEEANELLIVDAGNPGGTIDLGDSDQWRNFSSSIELGVDHIRTGPDHIFFILVLLLPSVLVLIAGNWRPAPSFGGSLLRVVIVATMFTIAHSVTFTLAGLDLIPLPSSKLVESLIAASIAAAALHNIKPIFGHREWLIAFVFGLFHGMGFAGLVEDLDIDRGTQLISLLGRNLGIEIGQLVIILISFPGLFLLRRTRYYMPLFYAASGALAVLASLWVVERLGETDLGFNSMIDSVLLWPRSLYAMIAFTAIAAIVYQIEAKSGRLLDVGRPDADDEGADPDLDSDAQREPVGV